MILFYIITGGLGEVVSGMLIVDTDYPNAAAAFQVFMTDIWRIPFGSNPNWGGTNILFSDPSIAYALVAKILRTMTGLSAEFNYLIVINFLLFGIFALRLARQLTNERMTQWLIVIMLSANLIMPSRIIGAQHIALGSYWVILWAMTSVRINAEYRKIGFYEPFFCIILALLSHSYLGAMAIVIVMVQLIFQKKYVSALILPIMPLVTLGLLGFFNYDYVMSYVAKAYGLNMAAYFYSLNWASTGDWYNLENTAQEDIYLYLGSGVILLLAAIIIRKIVEIFTGTNERFEQGRQTRQILRALLTAALLLALYATAFELKIASFNLASLEIPELIEPLYHRFRIAGRFGTVLCYVVIVMIGLSWGKEKNRSNLWWVISIAAVFLQISDAVHASKYATHRSMVMIQDKNFQLKAVSSVLDGTQWSGRVVKKVKFEDLESQRLLDYLLLQHEAKEFSVVHSARAEPQKVVEIMNKSKFSTRDLLVTRSLDANSVVCERIAHIKGFQLCLIK